MKIIVEIEDGMLIGVFTDTGEHIEGVLIDHDLIAVGEYGVRKLWLSPLSDLGPDSQQLLAEYGLEDE